MGQIVAGVHRRPGGNPLLLDRLVGVLLFSAALVLAWWWGTSLGLGELVRDRMGAYLGGALGAAPREAAAIGGVGAQPSAPSCAAGQQPQFAPRLGELRKQVGEAMGQPLECEHVNPENGDTLQKTTTGLAYYRKSTGTPMFTDGWRHWALTAEGLVSWEGESPDPPR